MSCLQFPDDSINNKLLLLALNLRKINALCFKWRDFSELKSLVERCSVSSKCKLSWSICFSYIIFHIFHSLKSFKELVYLVLLGGVYLKVRTLQCNWFSFHFLIKQRQIKSYFLPLFPELTFCDFLV